MPPALRRTMTPLPTANRPNSARKTRSPRRPVPRRAGRDWSGSCRCVLAADHQHAEDCEEPGEAENGQAPVRRVKFAFCAADWRAAGESSDAWTAQSRPSPPAWTSPHAPSLPAQTGETRVGWALAGAIEALACVIVVWRCTSGSCPCDRRCRVPGCQLAAHAGPQPRELDPARPIRLAAAGAVRCSGRVSPVWRRPAPGVRTAAASARRDPTRTASFVALVIAV